MTINLAVPVEHKCPTCGRVSRADCSRTRCGNRKHVTAQASDPVDFFDEYGEVNEGAWRRLAEKLR
jgi:hypothetical protein